MRRYWIVLFVAGGFIAGPTPLASQEPATVDSTYYAFTPRFEQMIRPFVLRGASLQRSTVRRNWEAPTISAGFFLTGGEGVWVNLGIGANVMVAGPFYAGLGAGAFFPGSFRPALAPHARLGARFGEVGLTGEIRVGRVQTEPLMILTVGFRI